MSRFKGAALAAAMALVAAGLLVLPTSAQADAETISGTVTDSNGDPVEGYCVTATRYAGSGGHTLAPVRTESDGTYEISNGMQQGDHKVEFALCQNGAQGPASNQRLLREYWNDKPTQAQADMLVVGEGETVTGVDAELTIGAEISGRVVGPDGEPVGACVHFSGPGTAHTVNTHPTGMEGAGVFQLKQRQPGEYVVQADDCAPDGGLAAEWYENKPAESTADKIVLGVGDQVDLGEIKLSEGGAIEGTVTDADGNELEGMCVDFYDSDGEWYDETRTQEDGTYIRRGFFPAEYRIQIADCDHRANVLPEYFEDAATLEEATPVAVAEGETETVDVELARGGSISGVVRGPDQRPLQGACVDVYGEDGYAVAYTVTDAHGRWTIGSLETGSYYARFDSCGATEDYFFEHWDNREEFEDADSIPVTSGQDTPSINATLGAPDPLDPETTITSGPAEGALVANPVTFGFGSDMDGSTFECKLDDGEFSACVSPHQLAGLAGGQHAFEVRAVSPVGLVDLTPASRSFRVKEESNACDDARAELRAAKRKLAKAKKKLKKAKRKLAKAKKKSSARKVKKAKKAVKRAKRKKRSAGRAARGAQRAVDRACGP